MNKEIEVWKDIEGYEGLYQVSSWGRIKSLSYNKTGKEKIMKQCKNKGGYLYVILWKDGKRKNLRLHRLVALAFIPNDNPTEKTIINHKDEDPSNNHIENLEWCTHQYNSNYGTKLQRQSEKLKGKKLSEEHKQKLSIARKGKYVGENNPMYGKKHTETTKQKMSKAMKGKNKGKISPKRKPIIQLDLQENFIREWDSATIASKELNIPQTNICNCCNGKGYKSAGGYIWRYK